MSLHKKIKKTHYLIICIFIIVITPLFSGIPMQRSGWSINPFAAPDTVHILIIRKVKRLRQRAIGCTPGKLYINGVYFCETLEKPFRNAEKNISSIHPGIYRAAVVFSRSKRQWRIQLQPISSYAYDIDPFIPSRKINRSGIQIHAGTRPEHSMGCILVGLKGPGLCHLSDSYEVFGHLLDTYFDSRYHPNCNKKIIVVIKTDYK